MKKAMYGVIAALSLLGGFLLVNVARDLYFDHQNLHKMTIWIYQKQAQEEQARQRQLQQPRAAEAPK